MPDQLIPVFDIGNVLVDWNPMYLFRKLFESEEEAEWFLANVCTPEWNLEFDAGEVYAEGVAKLTVRFPRYWREISAYDTRFKETFNGPIAESVAVQQALVKAEIPTFAITNFSWEKYMGFLGDWPFLSDFDGVVVSGLEGIVKPDPRIFMRFCERYSLAPDTCVFVDDSEMNVTAARKVGMHTIHYTTPQAMREAFKGFGFPV
jgi:FMN phosphatase YigB (HAD superfamily)